MNIQAGKLYRLPNGDWIDPADVSAVRAHDRSDFCDPHVAVWAGATQFASIRCDSMDDACVVRDRIANETNALKA